ncbi:MAG: HAD family hydrolase [Anaerolineae bacterium]|nr:HAD family hydrolase [Anaerolineae bacterium]
MKRTVLFFDMDGTLVANQYGRYVFPEVLAPLAAAAGTTSDALMERITAENWRRQNAAERPDAAWVMDWDDILRGLAEALGLDGTPLAADALTVCGARYATPPYCATLDDAASVLRRLREPGHRRLVVSTMGLSKYQFPVLRGLGLYDLFDDFLMPDVTGALKTERGFFAAYLDGPDAAEQRLISVGDNYLHDVAVPKRLGFGSVLRLPVPELAALDPFERPPHIHAHGARIQYYPADPAQADVLPDAVVVSLAELPAVIARMELGA